jgi:hypothetical protein
VSSTPKAISPPRGRFDRADALAGIIRLAQLSGGARDVHHRYCREELFELGSAPFCEGTPTQTS